MDSVSAALSLQQARRVVVKVGSSLLVDAQGGGLRADWMKALAADIARLREQGKAVALVSSGAVAAGRHALGRPDNNVKLEEKQALAAVGQMQLTRRWADVFAPHDVALGQVLLTLYDTEDRRRWLNSTATLATLLQMDCLPLINENDSVASDEIRYGDNDRLAARAAQMLGADALVLLSDVDGLYTADPTRDETARHIPLVTDLNDEIAAMAGDANSTMGTGGMVTKLIAARIAGSAGCATIIASGAELSPLTRIEGGEQSTLFLPGVKRKQARKHWIAGTLKPGGTLRVDAGAVAALDRGASLLPAGVVEVRGNFERGTAVVIEDEAGQELARGLVSYDASEARQIAGHQTGELSAILGYDARSALVHRDNLVRTRDVT